MACVCQVEPMWLNHLVRRQIEGEGGEEGKTEVIGGSDRREVLGPEPNAVNVPLPC